MATTVTTQSRIAAFQGVITIPLRTLTTTYTPSNTNWGFSRTSWPMEYTGYNDTGNNNAIGMKGGIFDITNVVTKFNIGTTTGAATSLGIGNPIYDGSRLRGFCSVPGSQANTKTFSYNPPLNGGTYTAKFVTQSVVISGSTNSPTPFVFQPNCQLGVLDIIYSSFQQPPGMFDKYAIGVTPAGAIINSFPDFTFSGANSGTTFLLICPAVNRNYIMIGNNSTTSGAHCLAWSDFKSFIEFYDMTWSNSDVNTLMYRSFKDVNVTGSSPFGWITCFPKDSAVVDGVTYNGFVILTSADGTRFWLLNIYPIDQQAAQWKGVVGSVSARATPDGVIWLHQSNQNGIIYVSAVENLFAKVLPIYPPISLPSPMLDTENTLLPYREGDGI